MALLDVAGCRPGGCRDDVGWYRSPVTDSDDDVTPPPASAAPASLAGRAAFAITVALLAVMLVISARADTAPAPSRTGRRVQLVELIRAEQRRTQELRATAADLGKQVAAFEGMDSSGEAEVATLQDRIDRVGAAAGMLALRGPGVVATLTDSRLEEAPSGNLNDLVVHEQDLQGVINGLWAGGAEAVSVNGQRVLSTTAIRCVGNTLLLHGAVYSPPYVIQAVGDAPALQAALDRDPAVQRFRVAARQYKLGFAVVVDDTLEIPAYDGAAAVTVARVAEGS